MHLEPAGDDARPAVTMTRLERADTARSDAALAASLAQLAGRRLLEVRREADGMDPAQLKALGDSEAQLVLANGLARARPFDAVLSEEAADDIVRLTAWRVWIIDPLDGTREFSEGRSDWAVHVALWERGDLVAGAVALPGLDTVLVSDPAPEVPPRAEDRPLRMAVSRSRPPAVATRVAAAMGAELVPMGSAGYKVAAVIRGEVDMYVHGGGQYEWDSAAPVAVARAAGLHTSRLDGSALRYNAADPFLPDLVVCRRDVASRVLDLIRDVAGAGEVAPADS
jgi:3'(2'), 5'-bisphosphate nucleotidase